MDVYCPRCGEPYEIYHLEHDASSEERRRFWDGDGCASCYGKEVKRRPFRAQAAEVLHDILGDDIDGLAAMMEDFEYAGMLDFDAEEE